MFSEWLSKRTWPDRMQWFGVSVEHIWLASNMRTLGAVLPMYTNPIHAFSAGSASIAAYRWRCIHMLIAFSLVHPGTPHHFLFAILVVIEV